MQHFFRPTSTGNGVDYADHKPYSGHSSHVTNVGFTHDDTLVVSAGGEDRALMQWEVVRER